MNIYFKNLAVSFLLLTCMQSIAAITPYSQDFESMSLASVDNQFGPSSELSVDGWEITGNVFTGNPSGATQYGDYLYFYGSWYDAPNSTDGSFSAVQAGDTTKDDIGTNYLMVYNDYNNIWAHEAGEIVNAIIAKRTNITYEDIGKTLTFRFDAKRPEAIDDGFGGDGSHAVGNNCLSICTSQAFIRTYDANGNYDLTNSIIGDTTSIPQTGWTSYTFTLELTDSLLIGQELHVGFENFATNYENSAVYYDNISISTSAVPLPAGIYLFLSGLVGLGLMKGKNGHSARH